ncbi:MAG: GTPase HflX [Candidatus Aminicenantia bacterium]
MERAVLVGIYFKPNEKYYVEQSLLELKWLAISAGAEVAETFLQKRDEPDPKFLIGEGKAEEIKEKIQRENVSLLIFDEDLKPSQVRHLEEFFGCKVIDRTQLILDIFAQRARSKEGKLQVELAQYIYLLPRLTGKGIYLSRLGGGIGTRGPGEKKLEYDRRRIKKRISLIKREIEEVAERRERQRERRKESSIPTVSLVGYTSAGKTTLFNSLTKESSTTSPFLFTTLDPLIRRVSLPSGFYFLLSDTVGFIRKLPVELVSAFKATLQEIEESELILHVIDISSKNRDKEILAVDEILRNMNLDIKKLIKVFNKIDLLENKDELLKRNRALEDRVFISAKTGEGLEDLLWLINERLFKEMKLFTIEIPIEKTELIKELVKIGILIEKTENNEKIKVKIGAKPELVSEFIPYFGG